MSQTKSSIKDQVREKIQQVERATEQIRAFVASHQDVEWDEDILNALGLGEGSGGHSKFDWTLLGEEPFMFSLITDKARRSEKKGGPWSFLINPKDRTVSTTSSESGKALKVHRNPSGVSTMGRLDAETLWISCLWVVGNRKAARAVASFEDVVNANVRVVRVETMERQREAKGHQRIK